MAGIWDTIKQLLLGAQQPPNPMVQNLAQAGFPGAQGMVQNPQRSGGAAGWLGQPSNQGALMQALGIPMAIMGSVEAARGKPVGAAYLEGIGGLLGDMGQQRSQTASQTQTANELQQAIQKQFPNSKGLLEASAGITDPVARMKQLDTLQKYFQGQSKTQKMEEKDINGVPYIFDPIKGTLTKVPGTFAPKEQQPPKPSFDMVAWARANHKDINNLTAQDLKEWQQYKSDPSLARLAQSNADALARMQKMWDHQDDIRNAKDAKERTKAQTAASKEIGVQAAQLAREGRTIMAKAKDPKFPQEQLKDIVANYNNSVESFWDRIGVVAEDLPTGWKRPALQKLNVNPAPGGGWLSWVPYVGSKFPVHGTVSSGTSSGDID